MVNSHISLSFLKEAFKFHFHYITIVSILHLSAPMLPVAACRMGMDMMGTVLCLLNNVIVWVSLYVI